jgi:hypothetical protein
LAIYTVINLLNNEDVNEYYQNAVDLWGKIWKDYRSLSVGGLSEILEQEQLIFEHRCGGKHLGQEIMVWSGFGLLYDIHLGFENENKEKALMLKKAFEMSSCSLEVKWRVKEVTKIFNLE